MDLDPTNLTHSKADKRNDPVKNFETQNGIAFSSTSRL
jgi:hypothetical protein